MTVTGPFQVRAEPADQFRIDHQHCVPLSPLAKHLEALSSAVRARSCAWSPRASEARSPLSKINWNRSRSCRCTAGITVRPVSTCSRVSDRRP
jgi:hypothetical protein